MAAARLNECYHPAIGNVTGDPAAPIEKARSTTGTPAGSIMGLNIDRRRRPVSVSRPALDP